MAAPLIQPQLQPIDPRQAQMPKPQGPPLQPSPSPLPQQQGPPDVNAQLNRMALINQMGQRY